MLVLCRWWRARGRGAQTAVSQDEPAPDVLTADEIVSSTAVDARPPIDAPEVAAESAHTLTPADPRPGPPPWPQRERNQGEPEPVTIGAASTFGSADWWTTDWWPLGSTEGDVVADFATIGPFAVAGVTLRGNKHRFGGDPGEDSFHLRSAASPTGERVACIAVCDGVGSASRSRSGARWLARATTARLALAVAQSYQGSPLSESAAREAITAAVQDVRELADRRSIEISALQTTLAFAVVISDGGVGARAVVGQIGDSPVFIGTDHGLSPAISRPDVDDPILTTATHDALSASPEALSITALHLAPGDRLLTCSDGVGNFLWSSAGPLDLGQHIAQTLRAPVPQLEFLRQASFDLRSADDDRTLVVLWTRPIVAEVGT
jgi:serine/threonine protein phosphatase PrpC